MIGEGTMTAHTETEQLREQLLRAQRLSSVGTLASSVAHEFNNILTTIMNYAKLGLKPDSSDAARVQAFEKNPQGKSTRRHGHLQHVGALPATIRATANAPISLAWSRKSLF